MSMNKKYLTQEQKNKLKKSRPANLEEGVGRSKAVAQNL